MTSISTIMFIDKLDDIVNKYSDTYITNKIKMNSINVKSGTYIDFNKENKKQYFKFEAYNHVRILKYKNIFAVKNGYAPNWYEDVFVIKKKKTNLWERFLRKNCIRQIKKNSELKE